MRGKSLMLQGTGSSVGKSLLCAALLRIFHQDDLRVAPFKAQNMALNSFVTRAGLEMGRAQVTQATAAEIEPDVRMNPVLLKPTSDRRSQVIVNGRPIGSMSAVEYGDYRPQLRETVRMAYTSLENDFDAIVIEGAGSPAEINLRAGDIVNMAMAEMADAPVLLIGDINPGGVFAALYGTVELLSPAERARIKGLIINKFRGDLAILKPGLKMLEELTGIPVLGVVPWMDVDVEDEDGASARFERVHGGSVHACVVKLPHISNFTDFQLLAAEREVSFGYGTRPEDIQNADIVILPGSKNTIEDLIWLKQQGLAEEIIRFARAGGMVIGICGGYQMLGQRLLDPEHSESCIPETAGLGLLDFEVRFHAQKTTRQAKGRIACTDSWLTELNGMELDGYEIHSGTNSQGADCVPFLYLSGREQADGVCNAAGNVWGSYLHGLFDSGALWRATVNHVRLARGLAANAGEVLTMADYRQTELNRLAQLVRQNLDMEAVYEILHGNDVPCGRWADD